MNAQSAVCVCASCAACPVDAYMCIPRASPPLMATPPPLPACPPAGAVMADAKQQQAAKAQRVAEKMHKRVRTHAEGAV